MNDVCRIEDRRISRICRWLATCPDCEPTRGSAHLLHARLWFAKRVERLPTSLVSYRWTNLLLRIIGTVHLNK